ncbi:hypothetical protein VNI00_001168 [Paramarasmius palmivorus]|uniref:Uncharacterized protein n=1 Tax=Paramarasmius palmivorus TaxID=297713 RepID=A0AAW0EAK3_9AGAR
MPGMILNPLKFVCLLYAIARFALITRCLAASIEPIESNPSHISSSSSDESSWSTTSSGSSNDTETSSAKDGHLVPFLLFVVIGGIVVIAILFCMVRYLVLTLRSGARKGENSPDLGSEELRMENTASTLTHDPPPPYPRPPSYAKGEAK